MYAPPRPFGIAYVIFTSRASRPQSGYAIIPDSVVAHWPVKRQYICEGELMAALLAVYNELELLRRVDILHFIDNKAALSAGIRGTSAKPDSAAMAAVYHLLLAHEQSRVWAEHVDSE